METATKYCNENQRDTCLKSPGVQSDLPRRVIDISNSELLKLDEPHREWAHQPKDSCAPSWPWASVDSTISYGNITAETTPIATVRICTVIPKDNKSPFERGQTSLGTQGPFAIPKTKGVNDLRERRFRQKNRDGSEWFKLMMRHNIDAYGTNMVDRESHEVENNPSLEW